MLKLKTELKVPYGCLKTANFAIYFHEFDVESPPARLLRSFISYTFGRHKILLEVRQDVWETELLSGFCSSGGGQDQYNYTCKLPQSQSMRRFGKPTKRLSVVKLLLCDNWKRWSPGWRFPHDLQHPTALVFPGVRPEGRIKQTGLTVSSRSIYSQSDMEVSLKTHKILFWLRQKQRRYGSS